MFRRNSKTGAGARLYAAVFLALCALYFISYFGTPPSKAQGIPAEPPTNGFRIGERLTYNVSMGRFNNAAYAELYTVSRGRLGDKDAIELRSKFKTLELASAAFYLIDETRTTFAAPSTGHPLYSSVNQNAFGMPKETIENYLAAPTQHFDLLTMIYKLRQSGGTGSLTMLENDKVYTVSFLPGIVERQKTDAGEFETTVVAVQSDYFTELGVTEVRVNLSTDEFKVPVLVRLKTAKGQFRAALSSVQMIEPETAPQPTPAPIRTPEPARTPKPVATPTPFVENLPLTPELAFELGERLEYRILAAGQQVAKMTLTAKERVWFNGGDNLVLEAVFFDLRAGAPFAGGDYVRAHVDPESLAPRQVESKFSGALRPYSGTVRFERDGSSILFGTSRVDAPVGTHSVLSLLYAARSFNLKPSRDLNNPINDTRVAVFWETQPFVFTLRPSAPEVIAIDGKQVAAQLVTVKTGNGVLDQLNIKVWLGNDEARIPLRFAVGNFQADLISATKVAAR